MDAIAINIRLSDLELQLASETACASSLRERAAAVDSNIAALNAEKTQLVAALEAVPSDSAAV